MLTVFVLGNLAAWGAFIFTGNYRLVVGAILHLLFAIYKVLTTERHDYDVDGTHPEPIIGIVLGTIGLLVFGGPLGSAALILGFYSIRNRLKYGIGSVILGAIDLGGSVLVIISEIIQEANS